MQLLAFGQVLWALPSDPRLGFQRQAFWEGKETTLLLPYTLVLFWASSQVFFLRAPAVRFSFFVIQSLGSERWGDLRPEQWVRKESVPADGMPWSTVAVLTTKGQPSSHFRTEVESNGMDHHRPLGTCCVPDAACYISASLPCNLAFIVHVKMALSPAPSFSGKPAGVVQHVQRERDALWRLWLACSFCSYPPGRLVGSLASIVPLFFMFVVSP